MIQELFRIGSFSISPFGVTLVAAFVVGYLQLRWGMRRLGIGDEEDASAMVFAGGLGGIAGAKIYYALLYRDWHLLFDRSGLVWYGGFLLGTAALIWTMRRRRLPAWQTADIAAPALALGYGIGRIGCFLVGDDYGRPTSLPWGVAFPVGLPPTTAGTLRETFGYAIPANVSDSALVRVHPTQLYETLLALLIWWIGLRLLRRAAPAGGKSGSRAAGLVPGPQSGQIAAIVVALLAVERFCIEFLRAKDDRFLGGLTLAQAISLGVLAAALAVWWSRRRLLAPRTA